jgi:membrane associated rhomboid family serine protease
MSRTKNTDYPKIVYSALPWFAFLIIMWILYFADKNFSLHYAEYGVFPRTISGLKGILFSPFVHGSFEHLMNNSLPLLILGTALFYFYGKLGLKVSVLLYFLSGLLVWLSARESYHIGASGLIYAFAGFLFMSGILRREKSLIAISLLVAFLYGSLFWGVFPIKEGISWEGHLWGGISGFVLAYYFRNEGPQRKKFEWELEEDEDEEYDGLAYWKQTVDNQKGSKPANRIVIHYDYKNKESQKDKDAGKSSSKS